MNDLCFASERGDLEAVRLLIQAGVEINSKNGENQAPMNSRSHIIHKPGRSFETLSCLVHCEEDTTSKNENSSTLYLTASSLCQLQVGKCLVSCAADLQTRDDEYHTPIHYAAWGWPL